MGSNVDGHSEAFMGLEAGLREADCAASHAIAEERLDSAVTAGIVLELDAEILKSDYPRPKEACSSYTRDEIYFFKKPDLNFSVYLDELVVGFNEVAKAEDQPLAAQESLLKRIFDRMANLAVMEMVHAADNANNVGQAILRTRHVLDIMCDDDNKLAPDLVRDDVLDNAAMDETHKWHALAVHRGENADHLRAMLQEAYDTDLAIKSPQTAPPPPHSTRLAMQSPPPLVETLARRNVPSPSA